MIQRHIRRDDDDAGTDLRARHSRRIDAPPVGEPQITGTSEIRQHQHAEVIRLLVQA
jgi:hypothetical protein